MTWTNAFDIGPCTVTVTHSSGVGPILFSDVVAKGATSSQFTLNAGQGITGTVSVTLTGTVQLNVVSGNTLTTGYILTVYPNYTVQGLVNLRVSDVIMDHASQTNSYAFGTNNPLAFVANGSPWTPNPAEIMNASAGDGLDVTMGIGA
jgi:hypothetical protein